MITYAELDALVRAMIDDEGSQRYLQNQDKIPAFNSAISRALTAGNWALANRKGSEEALIELKEDRVFQSNFFGGIALNNAVPALGHTVWSILAIYAEPITVPVVTTILGTPAQTVLVGAVPTGSAFPVRRMTAEQIAVARTNMYMDGNEVLAAGPMRTYAYYSMGTRSDNQNIIQATQGELFITPASLASRKQFWVSYLRTPQTITSPADVIDFPQSMKRTLADWACQYISTKQGEAGAGSLYSIAEKDAAQLFSYQAL